MINIKEYLKNNILICDGAMGTYYSEITGNDSVFCELSSLSRPDIIKKIHEEYIEAGAKLIRTNTFSANKFTLKKERKEIDKIITASINIAKSACKDKDVFIAASIGPIRDEETENPMEILDEYKAITDIFLKEDINIFIFETFSNTSYLGEVTKYIKSINENAFIICDFAITPDGFSRDGIKTARILNSAEDMDGVDVVGLNCASGPTIMYKTIKNLKGSNISSKPFAAMPNAGFPMVVHERSIFTDNPKFFAQKVNDIKSLGVRILGGCCGTKPSYIKELNDIINVKSQYKKISVNKIRKNQANNDVHEDKIIKNTFINKLRRGEFVTAVELSAPVDADVSKTIEGAKICKENGVDMVTIPDSPMGRVRADSVIISSKVKREVSIEVMPHVCCRDKNINAIRSSLLGAYIEGIRNVLAITGDPVCDAKTSETKNVFNLNSFKLIKLIKDTNEDVFNSGDMAIGGALNLNVINKESEYKRMKKKIENGAEFFLTQPIYEDKAIEFLRKIKSETNVKILAGIMPIVTYKNAMFLNNELPGVSIPKEIIERFSPDMNKDEAQEVGIEVACELAQKLKDVCDGFYFVTPFKRVEMIAEIIRRLNIK
ncbi:MAG: bifunctional homocysteine S-methyltransferase/methylenetetrahydrofolate reductase [Clostridiales bacterium]|nr:bifunctional homocysteine S-methyltransferase/methylenetetrahydrofolate reductase [Clostridium sp.]NLK22665.1 bifunctional homocysteine S-methyltransferase/methylenetetrahydrofolate reductase [Clostridiales bacterium]